MNFKQPDSVADTVERGGSNDEDGNDDVVVFVVLYILSGLALCCALYAASSYKAGDLSIPSVVWALFFGGWPVWAAIETWNGLVDTKVLNAAAGAKWCPEAAQQLAALAARGDVRRRGFRKVLAIQRRHEWKTAQAAYLAKAEEDRKSALGRIRALVAKN